MASPAYASALFSLPREGLCGVQSWLSSQNEGIWTNDTREIGDSPELQEKERRYSEPIVSDNASGCPPPIVQDQISIESPPQDQTSSYSPDFPSLGSSVPASKPRAYTDGPSLSVRDFRNSPFLVSFSSSKRKKKTHKIDSPAKQVWGSPDPIITIPLSQVQEEQKDPSKFFNTWGLSRLGEDPQRKLSFNEIQEQEREEGELELALQLIAEMEAKEAAAKTRINRRHGKR